ncbi:MAG: FKBP-type peptidyl-prolyl cis-trans isomerase [Nanoarchaeota archaeon]|nr:FKBP-type peptidyl-prolyl cis-trans isomerase [Nanoarchaeota archaeon]
METTNKNDFVEIKFTGYYDGKVFDSNIPEDLKKLSPEAKPEKTIVIIGQGMVVSGLDKALEGKEIEKEYKIHVPYKEGFGERKRELVKTIPLNVFTKQNINPYPGATLLLDNMLVRIITISGARVITDFNNPLAGKDLDYKFKIIRKLQDDKEKCKAFFKFFFKIIPKFNIQDNKVIIEGPKPIEGIVNFYKDKFKEVMGKELEFKLEEKEEKIKKEEKETQKQATQ